MFAEARKVASPEFPLDLFSTKMYLEKSSRSLEAIGSLVDNLLSSNWFSDESYKGKAQNVVSSYDHEIKHTGQVDLSTIVWIRISADFLL